MLAGEDLPPGPQQKRSKNTRERLLQSALELFGERGYEAASVEDIASGAGSAVGAFYQHFRNKRQLLLVLMSELLVRLEALTIPSTGDPRELIESAVREGLASDIEYAGAARAWREASPKDAQLTALDQRVRDWTRARLMLLMDGATTMPGARREVDLSALAWVLNVLLWDLIPRPETASEWIAKTISDLLYHTLFSDEADNETAG